MSPDLDRALERVSRVQVLLVVCDFDGTLSPIVADPAAAVPDSEAVASLMGLAELPRTPVLVLSGRGRHDLRRRLDELRGEVYLIGSHGAEADAVGDPGRSPEVDAFLEVLAPVAVRFDGSELETKPHSVAFHYRRVEAGRQEAARRAAVDAVGERAVDVRSGKKVVEFMAVRADKGAALERFQSGRSADAVVFLGDDVTDEAVFRALAPEDVGVKVGPEPTAAAFRVAGQDEVAAVLSKLLHYRTERIRG